MGRPNSEEKKPSPQENMTRDLLAHIRLSLKTALGPVAWRLAEPELEAWLDRQLRRSLMTFHRNMLTLEGR